MRLDNNTNSDQSINTRLQFVFLVIEGFIMSLGFIGFLGVSVSKTRAMDYFPPLEVLGAFAVLLPPLFVVTPVLGIYSILFVAVIYFINKSRKRVIEGELKRLYGYHQILSLCFIVLIVFFLLFVYAATRAN